MPFLEAAVEGVENGGVVAVAATDLTTLCGKRGPKVGLAWVRGQVNFACSLAGGREGGGAGIVAPFTVIFLPGFIPFVFAWGHAVLTDLIHVFLS